MLDLDPDELNFLKLYSIKDLVLTYDVISVLLSEPQKRFEQPREKKKLELRTEL